MLNHLAGVLESYSDQLSQLSGTAHEKLEFKLVATTVNESSSSEVEKLEKLLSKYTQ
jgi:hypothetical protein